MDEHQTNLIRCWRIVIQESKRLAHREVQLRRIIRGSNVRDPELIRELEEIRANYDNIAEFMVQLHNQLEDLNLLHFL